MAEKRVMVDSLEGQADHNREPKHNPTAEQILESKNLKYAAEVSTATNYIERQVKIESLEKKVEDEIKKGNPHGFGLNRKIFTRGLAAGIISLNLNAQDLFADNLNIEPQFNTAQTQVIERATGMPFAELSKKFDVELPVEPDKNNNYIIHIGQIHAPRPQDKISADEQKSIIHSQKSIYDLAQNIIETNGIPYIFDEGVSDERVPFKIKDAILAADKQSDHLRDRYIALARTQAITGVDIAMHHYLEPKIEGLKASMKEAYDRGISLPEDPGKQMTAMLTKGEASDPYLAGASFKLLMDGKIQKICPAIDYGINKKLVWALNNVENLSREYIATEAQVMSKISRNNDFKSGLERLRELSAKGTGNWTSEDKEEAGTITSRVEMFMENDQLIKDIKNRLVQARENVSPISSEREKALLKSIDTYDKAFLTKGVKLGNIPVVYGESHDFSTAVKEWNNQNPPESIDRGLIKLTPKE